MRTSLIFLLALMSCHRALLMAQKDVIRHQNGYIVFYYDAEEALFFPWKDTIDNKFLEKSHVNGYRIDNNVKDLRYLKKLAIDQKITKSVWQNDHSIQIDEGIKLLPVSVKFFWGEGWKLRRITQNGQRANIKYAFSNKDVELMYNIYDDRQILSIIPARKNDKIRVEGTELESLSN